MNWLDKLERKFGRYAIPHLTTYIIITYVIGYLLNYAFPSAWVYDSGSLHDHFSWSGVETGKLAADTAEQSGYFHGYHAVLLLFHRIFAGACLG